jgi:two-component system, NarL family, sensor kinase
MFSAAMAPASARSSPAAAPESAPGGRESERRVLLLYSEARLTPSVVALDNALRSTLESRSPTPIHFHTEFLDLNTSYGASIQGELHELLRMKYRERPVDVIVAQGQLTVPLALQARAELFPKAPIVFVAVDSSTFADLAAERLVTGTWRRRAWDETLDLARRFHHGTRRAVVVVGSTPAERAWEKAAREQLSPYAGSLEIMYLVDLSVEQVLQKIAALPDHSVVLAGPFLGDSTGRDFATSTVVSQIAAVSRVPVYALTEAAIGSGAVGGMVLSFRAHGKVAAELMLKMLAGERLPPTSSGTTVPMFDERQIKRWGIDRRLLPAGSVVLFHEPSVWERYRGYIVGAAGLLLLQSGLIVALLVQRAQRRRAQRSLAERLRFETLLSDLSRALASCPDAAIDQEIENGLRRIVEDLATDRASLWAPSDGSAKGRIMHSWIRPGVPTNPPVVDEKRFPWIFGQIHQGHVVRLPLPEGWPEETWTDREALAEIPTRSTMVAPLIEGGVVLGGLSVGTVAEERRWPDELLPRLRLLADIFAHALARQRAARAAHESARDIRDLAGRLITAQEEERRRIARELHDGVNQDLAALSIALSAIEDGLPESTPIDRRQQFARLQTRAVELAEAIRHLSHELHPGVLQYAGLATALRSHCREFERDHGLSIAYHVDDNLGTVLPDVALCLYRVTQEALRNAASHAKADHVWVSLERDRGDLVLSIRDEGRGFDLEAVRPKGGLGLISLDERVRLAGGRLLIDARPERGTVVRVVMPTVRAD